MKRLNFAEQLVFVSSRRHLISIYYKLIEYISKAIYSQIRIKSAKVNKVHNCINLNSPLNLRKVVDCKTDQLKLKGK